MLHIWYILYHKMIKPVLFLIFRNIGVCWHCQRRSRLSLVRRHHLTWQRRINIWYHYALVNVVRWRSLPINWWTEIPPLPGQHTCGCSSLNLFPAPSWHQFKNSIHMNIITLLQQTFTKWTVSLIDNVLLHKLTHNYIFASKICV